MRFYSKEFKSKMVAKVLDRGFRSIGSVSRATGVPYSTLTKWAREAGRVEGMRPTTPRRPQDWTAEEKLAVVLEAEGLSEEELGELLRRKGLHTAHLEHWRTTMRAALEGPGSGRRPGSAGDARRIRELERELRRKDRALAEASALLVLKKKAQAIWGDEDDDMDPSSGR